MPAGATIEGMRRYEIMDVTGDAGIRAFGSGPVELFVNAAMAMYSLVTDPETIEKKEKIEISVQHTSLEGLVVSWLNELIFRFDAYGFMAREINITSFRSPEDAAANTPKYSLSALLSGERFDPERHAGKLLIKAATYHRLKVEHARGLWSAEVIFDI